MITNTKALFAAVVKRAGADCICDIGSRDGVQALLFRDLCPAARVFAFEANHINYRAMSQDRRLKDAKIELFPYAVSHSRGTASFFVADVDYSSRDANIGLSSLLVKHDLKVRETNDVETRRIDEFILEHCPSNRAVALWIDVEGAEYAVLQGMAGIRDRVVAVHVEVAERPIREGQKALCDVEELMNQYGFLLCGSNIRRDIGWGDVVFVRRSLADALGSRFRLCQLKGYLSHWFQVDLIAVFLKEHFPGIYRLLRVLFVKFWT